MKRPKWITPHEVWFGSPFNLSQLKTFGFLAYENDPKECRSGKFGNNTKKGILVGYWQGIHNWRRVYPGNSVEYSHGIIFKETQFPGISPNSSSNTLEDSGFEEDFVLPVNTDACLTNKEEAFVDAPKSANDGSAGRDPEELSLNSHDPGDL